MKYNIAWGCGSANGRWGIVILSEENNVNFPAEGKLTFAGKVAGVKTYIFTPATTGVWVVPLIEMATVIGGGAVVEQMSLQSRRHATILVIGGKAVVEIHDKNGRGSAIKVFFNGEESQATDPILARIGSVSLAAPEGKKVPPQPPLEGAMAAAWKSIMR